MCYFYPFGQCKDTTFFWTNNAFDKKNFIENQRFINIFFTNL